MARSKDEEKTNQQSAADAIDESAYGRWSRLTPAERQAYFGDKVPAPPSKKEPAKD